MKIGGSLGEVLETLTMTLLSETGKYQDLTLTVDQDVINRVCASLQPWRSNEAPAFHPMVKIHTQGGIVTLVAK